MFIDAPPGDRRADNNRAPPRKFAVANQGVGCIFLVKAPYELVLGSMPMPKYVAPFAALLPSLLFGMGTPGFAQTSDSPVELVVLGSGGPGATGRAASSYLLLIDGTARVLVDAGPGSFARLGEVNLSLSDTDIVLLTHLHIDHVGELPGLFKARAVSSSGPIVFNVWGPAGAAGKHQGAYFPSTSRFLQLQFGTKGAFAYLSDFAAPITIHAHDIPAEIHADAIPHVIFQQGNLSISAIAGHHGDAPAVIYRIDIARKSITFSGDIDARGLPDLAKIANASDLLVFNSVVLDPPGSPPILYRLHTAPHDIGELANQAGVHRVLLGHLSPATDRNRDAVLASVHQNYSGTVTLAEDGMRIRP
jgi:ribonuclease BN (tRNA processing enzyme)